MPRTQEQRVTILPSPSLPQQPPLVSTRKSKNDDKHRGLDQIAQINPQISSIHAIAVSVAHSRFI
jgi:hypothetical protein